MLLNFAKRVVSRKLQTGAANANIYRFMKIKLLQPCFFCWFWFLADLYKRTKIIHGPKGFFVGVCFSKFHVIIVVRHVTTCRQVEVIFNGPMPACSGVFGLTPAGMGW